jgi:hypothetical protein
MITAERLRELLDYDPETGFFRWAVRVSSRVCAGDLAGATDTHGYRQIKIDGRLYRSHRLAWLHFYGKWPELDIDHVNGLRDDNRILNLREATKSQNSRNSRRPKNNSSGFKGVCWDGGRRRWIAYICAGNMTGKKSNKIGQYGTAEEAHAAYAEAAKKLHGDFARFE